MRHFISFIFIVMVGVTIAYLQKTNESNKKRSLKVFGYTSFTGKWGPGPELKKLFEKTCDCVLEYIDGSDSGILIQRLKIEGEGLGADVVIGVNQFDVARLQNDLKWREMTTSGVSFVPEVRDAVQPQFLPFDWGVLAFISKKGNLPGDPKSLDDLTSPELARMFAFQDPRTSSPGLEFLVWLIREKGEDKAFEMVQSLMSQGHTFSGAWSTAYGLFTKGQAKAAFSYTTSPTYHLIEEKSQEYYALPFTEAHPLQVEYVGIPDFCNECELAQKFVQFILQPESQKIIMNKNYMYPAINNVADNTPFANLHSLNIQTKFDQIPAATIDQWLKRWSEVRKKVSDK
jgi:thiamine transport system substrate-binding protein